LLGLDIPAEYALQNTAVFWMILTVMKRIAFSPKNGLDFSTVLKQRVQDHIDQLHLSTKANLLMVMKSIFFMGLISLAYGFLLLGKEGGGWAVEGWYCLLGVLSAFGTLNIVHDALHNAYMKYRRGNRFLGFVMDIFGGSSFYWKKEHTVDHHIFTNIKGHDVDLNVPFLIRVCPEGKRHPMHRFQHFYAPLLYCLNLMRWTWFSDYKRMIQTLRSAKPLYGDVFTALFFKVVHISLFLIIPMLVLNAAWWQILIGYISFLAVIGLILTTIFQLAHIVEHVAFPVPDDEGQIENHFFKHQIMTTANFATENLFVNFCTGGLNFQIEHHLFPHICHIHLPKIAKIVQKTAQEFGLPYHANPSFFRALQSHFRLLKFFGREEEILRDTH
jgi:linoleoyl-CoA desaturase